MISLCSGWEFTTEWSEEWNTGSGAGEAVRLPHNVKELPLHYADRSDYEMISGYRRTLNITPEMLEKRLFLQFDGAGHIATVFVNGCSAATHYGGYTAFRVEITELVHEGENLISVRLDSTENPALPPFGFVIDYLTYGGLYREVWLDVREKEYISDIFVTTPTLITASVLVSTDGVEKAPVKVEIYDGDSLIASGNGTSGDPVTLTAYGAAAWSPDSPKLYTCRASLDNSDSCEVTFGFRTIEFTSDCFLLNGKKTFMRGLNRHQSWPYMGYAAPERLQREDAGILKYELQCNAVRTSHYPQSQSFIDECDRLGIMVFTEIPGWQHVGNSAWQDIACENVREMVTQYRNHPSITLWGVRINESGDNDDFYTRTNAIAHELDPSRPTSGVRFIQKSSLLEDVYAFNDFSHDGKTPGCKPKSEVTPDMSKALFISEHTGHMFPTKSYDKWSRHEEHALRHARVLDAALADDHHTACFGWCMFDYQTHRDFGSGDRICYHGVTDSFRNPKMAAAVYASQGELAPVLEISSSMDIGDYNGGILPPVYAFTNADSVKLYKNDIFVKEFRPEGWSGLKHGPVYIDDKVGDLLESLEGFGKAKAAAVGDCLNACEKYGISNLPLKYKLKFAMVMKKYGLSYHDGYELYGKYIGLWGGSSTVWRFDAVRAGEVIKSITCSPQNKLHLEVRAGSTELCEGDRYDMSSVRVRVLDENNNPAPFAQLPISFDLTGDAALVGPSVAAAEGGMCGTYVKTIGKAGNAVLTVSAPGTDTVTVSFNIRG